MKDDPAGITLGPEPRLPRRIVIVAFGTRGDVQPFCILGTHLQRRGHDVRHMQQPHERRHHRSLDERRDPGSHAGHEREPGHEMHDAGQPRDRDWLRQPARR